MLLKFRLTHKDSDHVEYESTSLKDVFKYIRNKINMPSNWFVEELEDGDPCQFCNAQYLIENYTEETLPLTISDIM